MSNSTVVPLSCPISSSKEDALPKPPEDGKPPKPCCACAETRKLRDECVLVKGEENCQEYIESHKTCLRSYGFTT